MSIYQQIASFSLSFGGPIAIILSGFVAAIGIYWNARIAGKRGALDFIERSENSQGYREAVRIFRLYTSERRLHELHNPQTKEQKSDRSNILRFLNHYELISIGIRKKFLNQEIYSTWMETNFLVDWNAAANFIQRERWKKNETTKAWLYDERLWQNYQRQAVFWAKKRKRDIADINEAFSKPPERAEGVGDRVLLYKKSSNPFRKVA